MTKIIWIILRTNGWKAMARCHLAYFHNSFYSYVLGSCQQVWLGRGGVEIRGGVINILRYSISNMPLNIMAWPCKKNSCIPVAERIRRIRIRINFILHRFSNNKKHKLKTAFYRYDCEWKEMMIYTMALYTCQSALQTIPTVTLWSRPFLYWFLKRW